MLNRFAAATRSKQKFEDFRFYNDPYNSVKINRSNNTSFNDKKMIYFVHKHVCNVCSYYYYC